MGQEVSRKVTPGDTKDIGENRQSRMTHKFSPAHLSDPKLEDEAIRVKQQRD
jgi:hypothetical protein